MKIFFTICVLFISNVLSAQNCYELFLKYLPKDHLNYLSKEAIDIQLTRDASLHPSLIAWRLIYYNNLLGNKDYNNESNGLNFCRLITVQKYLERNDWIKSQLDILEEKYKSHEYYNKINEIFSTLLTEVTQIQINYYNNNTYSEIFNNFCQYIYISQNPDLDYDSTQNYSELLVLEKNNFLSKINNKWKMLTQEFSDTEDSFSDNIVKYWYLFNDNNVLQTDAPTLIMDQLINKNSTKRENKFTIQAGYINRFLHNSKNLSVNFQMLEIPIEVASIKNTSNYSFQFSYKHFFRDINSIFSYLNFSVIYTFGNISTEFKRDFYYRRIEQNDSKNFVSDYYEFIDQKASNTYKHGLYFKTTTPLLKILNVYIDGGLIFGLELSKTSFDITYNYIRVKAIYDGSYYHNQSLIYNKNVIASHSKVNPYFYISPVFSSNVVFFKAITTEFFVCYNAAGFNLGYSF